MTIVNRIKYTLTIIFFFIVTTNAQTSVSSGADFVSRYLWRGLDFGNTFSIQPTLALSSGDFEVGFWGSYPLANTANGSEEMDLYISYSISDVSLVVTDYYFPNSGLKYGKYKNPGAHTIEAGLSYAGSESLPLSLAAFVNVYNDDDNSMYFELGYSTEVSDVVVDFFVGGGNFAYSLTDKFNLTNIGIKASKEIKITENFSLPIFSSYVLNPNTEVGYLVFGVSL